MTDNRIGDGALFSNRQLGIKDENRAPSPIIEHAKGSKLYDVDGNEYTDYCLNCGVNILGHANHNVVLSAKKHAERGICFGATTKAEIDLSRYLIEKIPSLQKVRFVNSGTEATLSAIRLARCVTGRRYVVSFEGMYHGFHGLVPVVHHQEQCCDCSSSGMVLPFNDILAFERAIEKNKNDIACVIMEPVAVHMGIIPARPDFLTAVRDLTKKHGIVLIFDEIMTGFRGFPGCVESELGMVPDLTCLGTVIGGGFPIGVYGGRADMMRWLAPEGNVFQAGTFAANPVILRAGMMTLRLMNENFYKALNRKADRFAQELNMFFEEHQIEARIVQWYSMLSLRFSKRDVNDYKEAQNIQRPGLYTEMFQYLLARHIYFPPVATEPFFISGKHSKADLNDLADAIKTFMKNKGDERC